MALALQLGFLALVGIAHGYTPSMPAAGRAVSARGAVRMFFESQKGTDAEKATSEFVIQSRRNHASDLVTERTGASIVVTEGSNNFYGARTLVQMLHDFGSAKQITAVSDDAATTKKALLTAAAMPTSTTVAVTMVVATHATALSRHQGLLRFSKLRQRWFMVGGRVLHMAKRPLS